jgi:hypothetical protein
VGVIHRAPAVTSPGLLHPVDPVGIEPTHIGLKVRRSAAELQVLLPQASFQEVSQV